MKTHSGLKMWKKFSCSCDFPNFVKFDGKTMLTILFTFNRKHYVEIV